MTEETGREKTERWITMHDVKDGGGTLHRPHGIWTSLARLTVYVCFDGHPTLGRRAFYFFTHRLQRLASSFANARQQPIMGSTSAASVGNTGAGYLFTPHESGLDRIEKISGTVRDDDPGTAVAVVKEQMAARVKMGPPRNASIDEQYEGVDVIFDDPLARYGEASLMVEVKSRRRHQSQPQLFLQLSETNPDRIIS